MVVVVLITGAAAAALYAYGRASQLPAEDFESKIFSVKQQAGVVGAFAGVVFAVLTALTLGKQAASLFSGADNRVQPKTWANSRGGGGPDT